MLTKSRASIASLMRLVLLLASLPALLTLPGCATNPATGKANIVLMSEKQEIKLGREAHEKMMEEGAAYDDPQLQHYVNQIGQRLAAASDRPDISYTFTVINNENINAFALPGGYIYINRGLMIYLDNEPELAAVLSHEIGHVTARHAVRQQTANAANNVLAQLAYATTGSSDLAQASNMYGTSLVRGYGREHELEADGEGATYLHNAGYDPNALLEVIGVLKDQEQYNKVKANAAGKKSQAYHGLYATHPRNDKRLQQVVRTATELEPRVAQPIDPAEFRKATEDMAFGKTAQVTQREEDRYYHNKLGFTFAYPEGWTVDRGSKAIVTHPDDDSARVTLTIQRMKKNQAAADYLRSKMGAPQLFQTAALSQAGLAGYTGVAPGGDGKSRRRVAILHRGTLAYIFEADVTNDRKFTEQDANFMEVIESFRPMKKSERKGKKQQYIHWVLANENTTMASLARGVRIPDAENQLRLMNGFYPRGEPRAGDWLKTVKEAE
ncbi:MAG: M48 family metalloprotease [Halieaceae bacterium]